MPEELRGAIAAEAREARPAELQAASREVTERYRRGELSAAALKSPAHRLAYLLARMPATYAANVHVLSEIRRLIPGLGPRSLLDLGGGPGTSAWAAVEVFPSLERVTVVERDAEMVAIGRRLASAGRSRALGGAKWVEADLSTMPEMDQSDLIIVSYALGELGPKLTEEFTRSSWRLTAEALAIIEPGTMRGFAHVLAARTALISAGAPLVAPCPHEVECPMAAAGDWCHFAQRVERTAEHRRMKGAELGYEDEKFSYVAAAREPFARPEARIVRRPQKRSGHVELTLCTAAGLKRRAVGRSEKRLYRGAREAKWGWAWDESRTGEHDAE